MKIISYLKDKENLKAGLLSVLKKAWGKTWLAVNQFIDKNLFQYAGALAFNTVLAIVPLVTALLSFLFGDERLSLLQWGGLAIGMVGIFLTQMAPAKK